MFQHCMIHINILQFALGHSLKYQPNYQLKYITETVNPIINWVSDY